MKRSVNGDHGEHEDSRRRRAGTEPEGQPDQEGNTQEFHRIMFGLRWKEAAEDGLAHKEKTQEHDHGFSGPRSPQSPTRARAPQDQQWSYYQRAAYIPSHQVSQIEPNLAHEAKPVSERLATPTVALTVVLTIPASTANL